MNYMLILLLVFCIFQHARPYSISRSDNVVKLQKVAAGYKIFMPENNHDNYFKRALFTISVEDNYYPPEIQKNPGFEYSWDNNRNDWTFYSEQSFDYETQRRTYIIEVQIGTQHKTLTLYIVNIDDEPPSIDCSGRMELMDNRKYTLQNSPCECAVSDPDGFLNDMTFSLTGPDGDKFKMGFPKVISDKVQHASVKIVNTVALNGESMDIAFLTIEAKDGAGHHTVPEAKISVAVTISRYD